MFKSEFGNINGSGISNAELDNLITLSEVEIDEINRRLLLRQIEEIIIEKEFPVIPLFFENYTYLFNNDKYTGWYPNKGIRYSFKNVRPVIGSKK